MSAVDIIDGRGYILNVEFGGGKDGVDGKDGRDGVAPDLQIGTVKESEDDQPHVTISDEGDGKLSLNFDLVSGKDGQNGEDGGVFIPSVSQEGVISWIAPEGQNPPQAVSVKGETGATFTPTVSIGGEISWTNDKGLENPYEQNIRGPKGEKGDPFTIYKVYNSKAEMDADYSNPDVPMGAFVCITNSVDQSENARLYVKGTQEYTFITDLSGATGMHGVPGVGIGRVGLMDNQPSPLYKEYGVWSDQTPEVLLGTFNLPVGEDGQQGNDGVGIESIEQTTKSHEDDGVNVITVKLTDGKTSTFNVENGSKGSTGAQGPAGQDGQNGQDGVGIDDITIEQSTFDGQPNVVTVHLSDETTKTFNVYNGHTGATGTAGILHTNNSTSVSPGPGDESMSNDIRLHKISKTGNYNDLLNKPTIPAAANDSTITIQKNGTTVNTFTLNQSSPKTINMTVPVRVTDLTDEQNYVLKSSLATVATSGSYSDLSNKPIIGNAELKIRSVNNTSPESYYNLGTFSANATDGTTIDLAKVARTGNYSDLIGAPIVGNGTINFKYTNESSIGTFKLNSNSNYTLQIPPIYPLFKKTNDWSLIYNNDDFSCYTILMGVKKLFKHIGDPGSSASVIMPRPFLMFDQTGTPSKNNSYIPLAPNKSYIIECCISAVKLHAVWNGDSVESITTDDTESSSVNMIFYIYVRTGNNGGIYNYDDVRVFDVSGNISGASSVIDDVRFIGNKTTPYGNNQSIEIIECSNTITAGSVDEYYKQLYDEMSGVYSGDSVLLTLFYPHGRPHGDGYCLGISIPMNTANTNGIDAFASLRCLKCAPVNYQYDTSNWDIDTVDYIN